MHKLYLASLALVPVVFASCRSTQQEPPVLQLRSEPPEAPGMDFTKPAPVPPRAPSAPAALQVSAPPSPSYRQETIDEVFQDIYYLDAVPRAFPFDGDVDVVLSVPKGTNKSHRAALMGAFLAAGFPVKDAGEFSVASFHINDRPWWYDREGFQRVKLPEGVDLKDVAELPAQEYGGLSGMEIALEDPTSLWAPDLLANQNLESDYFLRLFEMSFDETDVNVELRKLFDPAELEAYREALSRTNASIAKFNENVDAYSASRATYAADFAAYVKRYEQWDRDQTRTLEKRQKAFAHLWGEWKSANADVIAAREVAGIAEASWTRARPDVPGFELPGIAVEASLREVAKVAPRSGAEIDALEQETSSAAVPCRRLRLLAEVVDAKTGHVVWVGEAVSLSRKGVRDSTLLRETVRRLTQAP
ncbi:hypothetical protein Poly30_53450 [Planctomycetes bacterium Poly30]|uniref:Uncharacterized protein n=1 Tax=Saltatorellus ferox TaxID=2528018 RepID=A0A518F0D0_9BACT|nr:hypothetical protein Poly30_53450 [Planctomycetes bacterium Poly30]